MTFVTKSTDLTNPTKHKTKINSANGEVCFAEDMGKYRITNDKTPIYVTALSAPAFTKNLISVGQLAINHNVVFNKNTCYLQGPTPTPLDANVIAFKGTDKLYRTNSNLERNCNPWKTVDKKQKSQAAPEM